MKGAKMRHKCVTQMLPNSVPRTNLIYTRGGVFYFRRRIPTDLVRANAYGGALEIRESLKTSDKRKAESLAHLKALELLDEWEIKRKELRGKGVNGFDHRSKFPPAMRPLSSLTPLERRAFIHRFFIRLEKSALKWGTRDPASLRDDVKGDLIENTKTDLAVMMGNSQYAPLDWGKDLAEALEEQGIEIDRKADAVLQEMRQLIARAHVESAKRTLRTLEGEWMPREDPLFADLVIGSEAPELAKSISLKSLGIAYTQHQKEIGSRLATLAKTPQCIHIMTSLWGEDTPVASIGREQASKLINFLRKIPKNASKFYPANMSLQRMSELEGEKESPQWISAKTLRNHFVSISAMLNFAVDEGWLDANPLSNRNLVRRLPEVEREAKPMMTPAEISLVITSDKFKTERTNGPRGHARFWVPLLCLFHGMRSNEACQLLVSDVIEDEGIPYLNLRPADDEGKKVKTFKTKASIRRIPLHDEIIKIGFLRFVETQRAAGQEWLFPALTPNRLGSRSDTIGKWFGRLRKELITDLPKLSGAKSLHSFRHTFERILRDNGVEDSMQFALGGWVDKKPRNSSADYGDGYGIKALKKAIDRVKFPGVDFSPLYVSHGLQ